MATLAAGATFLNGTPTRATRVSRGREVGFRPRSGSDIGNATLPLMAASLTAARLRPPAVVAHQVMRSRKSTAGGLLRTSLEEPVVVIGVDLPYGSWATLGRHPGSGRRGLAGVRRTRDAASVVPDFAERIYDLATHALAEQERQVSELRGRGAALLAAAAVVASLLANSVFHAGHPRGLAEVAAASGGLIGAAGVLVFVVLLLRPYELGFSVKAGATYRALWDQDVLEQPMVDLTLADAFEDRRAENAQAVNGLVKYLSLALAALVVEATGFAIAAALSS